MTLRIRDKGSHADTWAGFARPWGAAERAKETPVFAKSHAYSLLIRELNRYLQHQIRGRSFLISGHRGSGKTSLVLRAVQDLQNRQTGELQQRPLLVKLHGPSLLNRVEEQAGQEQTDAEHTGSKAREEGPALAVLVEITIALYRALSGEVARCYRDVVFQKSELGNEEDLKELAGQLSLELDNAPGPALLREFWTRVDAMRSGVLWLRESWGDDTPRTGRVHWRSPGDLFRRPYPEQMNDQGVRELVAISTAAQAFQVVSGSITYKAVEKDDAQQEQSLKSESKPQIKEIANAFFGLFAGVLVGGTAFMNQAEPHGILTSTALGLITAFATGFTLTRSTTRKRSKTMSREHSFIRERTVANLDRELPIVIERIRAAGLAPVFVVDELDKVDDLVASMAHLVQRLKHLVADYSFFCFLTDRDYFEYLHDLSQHSAYPKEHTYFSHRLFVLYQPDNLHQYLDELIQVESGGAREESGKFAISYLLLHRAMMHTFDLQRELAKVCDDEGKVIISTGELRTDMGYRYQIMIQLAVEILLQEPELRHRLNEDPQFGQITYDALYMPSRMWMSGEPKLDLSDRAIERYLHDRLKHENLAAAKQAATGAAEVDAGSADDGPNPPADGQAQDAAGVPAPEAGDQQVVERPGKPLLAGLVRETDRRYLIGLVHRLVEMLARPKQIVDKLTEAGVDDARMAALIESIPLIETEGQEVPSGSEAKAQRRSLIVKVNGGEGVRYRWTRDPFGRELFEEERLVDLIDLEVQLADQRFIDAVVAIVDQLGGGDLSPDRLAEMGILRRTPDWEQVRIASERLALYREDHQLYEELLQHQDSLHEYAEMITRRGGVLSSVIIAGAKVGVEAGLSEEQTQIAHGVTAVSTLLELKMLEFESVRKRIGEFLQLNLGEEVILPVLSGATVDEWSEALQQAIEKVRREKPGSLAVYREQAWEQTIGKVQACLLEEDVVHEASMDEAACLAAQVFPPEILMMPADRMTVAEASRIILRSMDDMQPDAPEYVPMWVAVPLLYLLGLPVLAEFWPEVIKSLLARGHFSQRTAAKEEAERAQVANWKHLADRFLETPQRPSALIISVGTGGEVSKWTVSREYGVVAIPYEVLRGERFPSIPVHEIVGYLQEAGVVVVFVEFVQTETEQRVRIVEELSSIIGSLPLLFIGQAPLPERQFERQVISHIETLDSAMREALEKISRNKTAS